MGHLRDHCAVAEGALLHWLFPGKEPGNGLRVLLDDKACQDMSGCIVGGGVADIFLEDVPVQVQIQSESREKVDKKKKGKEVCERSGEKDEAPCNNGSNSSEEDDEYSDYMPRDVCSSEEDDEASDILKMFKAFKMKFKSGEVATLDDVELGRHAPNVGESPDDSDGYATPCVDSDDESVEEFGSDGELRTNKDHYRRFNFRDEVPKFQLGMNFSGKKEFKDAIIRYCLHERKVVNFIKDQPTRVRAKCDWQHYSWVCLCSKNSRTRSWQIATFLDEHTCPPRRDNKLVTARRVADKYEKFIMANPSWSFRQMKNTVQEEMFADVSISKLKRAKAIVMEKVYDST